MLKVKDLVKSLDATTYVDAYTGDSTNSYFTSDEYSRKEMIKRFGDLYVAISVAADKDCLMLVVCETKKECKQYRKQLENKNPKVSNCGHCNEKAKNCAHREKEEGCSLTENELKDKCPNEKVENAK